MSEQSRSPREPTEAADEVTRIRVDGFAALPGIVDPDLIASARAAFLERYARFLRAAEHADALTVGNRRYMVTLEIEPPFDDVQFLANPRLMPIVKTLLGNDCVLGNYGVVCSLPGAAAQAMHYDGGDLFPETRLDDLLPVTAITMAIPLREMNDQNGTTALWPMSHRRLGEVPTGPGHEPVVSEGDVLLWDYRLRHLGTANRSELPRPLLYATYCRQWYLDQHNFAKQPPFSIGQSAYSALPDHVRRLLVRAVPRPD
jgi:hypothetical protein